MYISRIIAFSRWLLLCAAMLAITAAVAAAPAGAFSDELDADLYDCILALHAGAHLPAAGAVQVALEWQDARNYLNCAITRKSITLDVVRDGKKTRLGEVAADVTPGAPYALTIMRRGPSLGLLRNEALIYRVDAPRLGAQAGITAGSEWTVDEARVQRMEPVVFADNFMRTADNTGEWALQCGEWKLHSSWDDDPHGNANRFTNGSYAINPFSWVGKNAAGAALCTVGNAAWEDYTFTASVQPSITGAAGVMVNMPDAHSGLLVRWSPANDRGPRGDQLALYKMTNGGLTLLQTSPGGYLPGQWYRLAVVSSLAGIRVLIDGSERLAVKDTRPWRGGVGLYAEGGTGAVFDGVSVYGRSLNKDLLAENKLAQLNQRFVNDPNGLQEWTTTRTDWAPMTGDPALQRYQHDCYGDHWVSVTLRKSAANDGQLWLGLNNDGTSATSGYRAVVTINPAGKASYQLFRDTTLLTSAVGEALTTDEEYTLRFRHGDGKLWLEVDGARVLEAADPHPLPGLCPTYRAEGSFSNVHDEVVLGKNMLDDIFADAPVDWVMDGTWMPTMRWACSPQWSFLGGWSRGNAVLWHKMRFTGDHMFEAFTGVKMEYPREIEHYDYRYHNLAVSICTDGKDPLTGYTGIYGADGEDGKPNARTVLMRNGVVVGASKEVMPGRGAGHRQWFDLRLVKKGATVEFWVEGKLQASFTDPQPIDGGAPCVWTHNNGVIVTRARLSFANPPQPHPLPRVVIDAPWYPEWINDGQPITLNFPDTWSTSGLPVQLTVTPRKVPEDEKAAPVITNKRIVYTPTTTGEHWYQITATDGANSSLPYHFSAPAFNPRLGRDDSHAVVLYRFDEGSGDTVVDHGVAAPPANLHIPHEVTPLWAPGQGLALRGVAPCMMTPNSVEKLGGIIKSNACTIELWLSTDTVYPPPFAVWSGCMLAWEGCDNKRNFALGHLSSRFYFTTASTATKSALSEALVVEQGMVNSLHHLVITWDGAFTRYYLDGEKIAEKKVPWNTDAWDTKAPLFLGTQPDGTHGYVGTYYLAAIHDRCLSDADVTRHYTAGPSAR